MNTGIKNKLNDIKEIKGKWDTEQNKNNIISTVEELKNNIKLLTLNLKMN